MVFLEQYKQKQFPCFIVCSLCADLSDTETWAMQPTTDINDVIETL